MDFTEIYKSLSNFNKNNKEFNKNADEIDKINNELQTIINIDISKLNKIDEKLEKDNLFLYNGLILDYNTFDGFNEYKKILEKFLNNIDETYQKDLNKKKQDFFKFELSKIINFKILRENINKYFIDNIIYFEISINDDDLIINDIYLTSIHNNPKMDLNKYYDIDDKSLYLSFKFKKNYMDYISNLINFIQQVIKKINMDKEQKIKAFNANKEKLLRIENTLEQITKTFYKEDQVGGNEEIDKIRTVNLFLLDLIQEFNQIKKIIIDYNKNLYEIYYFLLFMYNEDKDRTYSLFSMKYISKKFIEEYLKYYNKIKNIDKFNLINEIINNYLIKPSENTKYITMNNKNGHNFILLLDKFNTYLRQYIDQKEKIYNIKFNLENIFFVGNRKLQDLVIYYNGINININKLIQYFYLSNMYLIKSIEINNKKLSKYSDIKNLTLENNVSIKINNEYNYKFTNIIDEKNIIKINFI
jgi:hypothetical protein